MKIISHRGNLEGPVPVDENNPSYIDKAISEGFDVEIDLYCIGDTYWLGHDEPQYQIDVSWLSQRKSVLWIHCKNIESAKKCLEYNSFCHSEDPFVYTTNGKIWLHGNVSFLYKSCENMIVPLIDEKSCKSFSLTENIPYGICTDYPMLLRSL